VTPHRLTWIDAERVAWRVEVIDRRWVLGRWLPITETWLRGRRLSSRVAALEAAYEENRP
jgi:hypothetical protein